MTQETRPNPKIHAEFFQAEKVVENLFSKTPKCALVIGGGGQRGAFGGGGVMAFEKLGLRNAFLKLFLVSTGVPTGLYFLAGQAEEGTSIYYSENAKDKNFIDLSREPIMDIDWLIELFRNGNENGEKKLNLDAVLASQADVFIALTSSKTGEGKMLSLKQMAKENDLFEVVKAACAVPEVYGKEIELVVDGKKEMFVDGGVGKPMPLEEAINDQNSECVIVLANRFKGDKDTLMNKALAKFSSLVVDPNLSQDVLNNDEMFDEQIQKLKKSGKPFIIFWTDNTVRSIDTRNRRLVDAAINFENYVYEFIAGIKAKLDQK